MTHDRDDLGSHLEEASLPMRVVEPRRTVSERTGDGTRRFAEPDDGHAGPHDDHRGDHEGVRVVDLSGRWVWRGRGGHGAHLIRERSTASSTPWTLCGRRMRQPRLAWRGICPTCRSRAHDLAADLDVEPVPPSRIPVETNDQTP